MTKLRLLQSQQSHNLACKIFPDFAERMKRKALRVRSEGSIPPYVTEAESRKQHSDLPLCNGLRLVYLDDMVPIGREVEEVGAYPLEATL